MVAFVKASDFAGDRKTSPFDMRSRWIDSDDAAHPQICHLTKVSVIFNGQKLDLLESELGPYDMTVAFFRFNKYLGMDKFFSSGTKKRKG